MRTHCIHLFFSLLILLIAACTPQAPKITALSGALATPSATLTTAALPEEPTPTAAAEPSPTAQPSPTQAPQICSPLAGVPLAEMRALVSNPFHPPKPGSDEPHQGVDLAIRQPGTQMALAGNPVQAALPGIVAMVTRDRFPFGNAVLIETPLESYPAEWWSSVPVPTPAPAVEIRTALTCPAAPAPTFADPSRRSLYILYAHLQEPAPVQVEDAVTCGQEIGKVGQSGNALNPHLHFEVKVGPAGLRLSSMAHYDASATPAEMSNYCLWSVSSLLQLVDPLELLKLGQAR